MLTQFLVIYVGVGIIALTYFILFIHIPVMEEFKPIMFRRDLKMPRQYKFPANMFGLIILAVIYPYFVYQSILCFIDGENVLDTNIEIYRKVLWSDIEEENNI